MEVEVKMEQNQKMKNLILMQVSKAVHTSSEENLFFFENKIKICLRFLSSFI